TTSPSRNPTREAGTEFSTPQSDRRRIAEARWRSQLPRLSRRSDIVRHRGQVAPAHYEASTIRGTLKRVFLRRAALPVEEIGAGASPNRGGRYGLTAGLSGRNIPAIATLRHSPSEP